jgi:hypothetical protein
MSAIKVKQESMKELLYDDEGDILIEPVYKARMQLALKARQEEKD